jgi:hypothetical protein
MHLKYRLRSLDGKDFKNSKIILPKIWKIKLPTFFFKLMIIYAIRLPFICGKTMVHLM